MAIQPRLTPQAPSLQQPQMFPMNALEVLLEKLAPYFRVTLENIQYLETPATEQEVIDLESIAQLFVQLTTTNLVDAGGLQRHILALEGDSQVDFTWVIKFVVLPYAIAYQKMDAVTAMITFETYVHGSGETVTELYQLAKGYIYENKKFGALTNTQAQQQMWQHIQCLESPTTAVSTQEESAEGAVSVPPPPDINAVSTQEEVATATTVTPLPSLQGRAPYQRRTLPGKYRFNPY